MAPAWYSLVHVALGTGREVRLHHRLKLRLVAAVFEHRVVMVTAEHEGFVVREPGAVEAKVIAAFVVRVWLTHSEMRGQDWKTESPGSVGGCPGGPPGRGARSACSRLPRASSRPGKAFWPSVSLASPRKMALGCCHIPGLPGHQPCLRCVPQTGGSSRAGLHLKPHGLCTQQALNEDTLTEHQYALHTLYLI